MDSRRSGYQLSFITGGRSGEGETREADLAEGKGVMTQSFRFVGLLEHYNASVCLFHASLGPPWSKRPGIARKGNDQVGTGEAGADATVMAPMFAEFKNIHRTPHKQKWRRPDGQYDTTLLDNEIHKRGKKWKDPDEVSTVSCAHYLAISCMSKPVT